MQPVASYDVLNPGVTFKDDLIHLLRGHCGCGGGGGCVWLGLKWVLCNNKIFGFILFKLYLIFLIITICFML